MTASLSGRTGSTSGSCTGSSRSPLSFFAIGGESTTGSGAGPERDPAKRASVHFDRHRAVRGRQPHPRRAGPVLEAPAAVVPAPAPLAAVRAAPRPVSRGFDQHRRLEGAGDRQAERAVDRPGLETLAAPLL